MVPQEKVYIHLKLHEELSNIIPPQGQSHVYQAINGWSPTTPFCPSLSLTTFLCPHGFAYLHFYSLASPSLPPFLIPPK